MSNGMYIPEELITHILIRLPAKALLRFKCVSKDWGRLLRSTEFVRAHFNFNLDALNHPEEQFLITGTTFSVPHVLTVTDGSNGVLRKLVCPVLGQDKELRLNGSCNGLALLTDEMHCAFLMNPTTLQVYKLPTLDALSEICSFVNFLYGLCHDVSADDYKIVVIRVRQYSFGLKETFVDVFSRKSKTWRKPRNCPFDGEAAGPCLHMNGVLVEGNLHWLCCKHRTNDRLIAAFDPTTEEFHFDKVGLPKVSPSDNMLVLTSCGGKLAVLARTIYHLPIDVWIMQDYPVQESWTKFRIEFPNGLPSRTAVRVDFMKKPSTFLRNGRIVLGAGRSWKDLVAYDLDSGEWEYMEIGGDDDDALSLYGWVSMFPLKQSLLSPEFKQDQGGATTTEGTQQNRALYLLNEIRQRRRYY